MTVRQSAVLDFLRETSRRPVLLQVLSLYLLLLAFFVLLNSMSTIEEDRLRAVKGSLNETFTADGRPARRTVRLTSSLGNVVDDAGFMDRIGDLVRTELDFAEVREVVPGRVMEVSMPAERLFRGGAPAIDPLYRPALEHIAQAMKWPPRGVRYDVDLLVGTDGRGSLPADRSAWLATVFGEAGVPPRSIAAGVEIGSPGRVRLRFRIRSRAESRLNLGPPAR